MTTMTAQTTQVYSVFIKATPEQIWDAITKPEFTQKYFYGVPVQATADRYDGGGSVEGSLIEFEPATRLVHTWRALHDTDMTAEDESRVTWEIEPQEGGFTKLTVVHDKLEGAPKTAESVAGGWMLVLSGLKTLLETGSPLAG